MLGTTNLMFKVLLPHNFWSIFFLCQLKKHFSQTTRKLCVFSVTAAFWEGLSLLYSTVKPVGLSAAVKRENGNSSRSSDILRVRNEWEGGKTQKEWTDKKMKWGEMYERDVKADRQVWGRRVQECDLELSPSWPVGAVSPMWRWSKQAI